MSDYKYLLWDIDGTVLDFLAAEKDAIKTLFYKYGLGECTDEMVELYSGINVKYWEALERGEMTKQEILVGRFKEFFREIGIHEELAEEFNSDYQVALGDTIVFRDNAFEVLENLKGKYILAAVTNGTRVAQDKKLDRSGLRETFDYIFISEEIGFEKPNIAFFEYAFEQMQVEDLATVLIIGDSLTSDIKGGNNVGIDTCWYNPNHLLNTKNVEVTHEISHLEQIGYILED